MCRQIQLKMTRFQKTFGLYVNVKNPTFLLKSNKEFQHCNYGLQSFLIPRKKYQLFYHLQIKILSKVANFLLSRQNLLKLLFWFLQLLSKIFCLFNHPQIEILLTQRILIYDAKVPSPAEILTRNQGARFDGGSLRHISLVFCTLVQVVT